MKKRPQPAAVREALAKGDVKPSLIDKAKNTANDDLYVDPYEEFEEKEMPAEAAAKFREDLAHIPRLAALRKRATADPHAPRESSGPRMSPSVRVQHYEDKIVRRPPTAPVDCFFLFGSKAERDVLDSNATFDAIEVEFATLREGEFMTAERFETLFPTLRRRATGASGLLLYYWGEVDKEVVVCLRLDEEDRSSVLQYYYLPGS